MTGPPAIRLDRWRRCRVAGIDAGHSMADRSGIPAQWDRFHAARTTAAAISARPGEAFGVCHRFRRGGAFRYLCGVPVHAATPLPDGWRAAILPSGPHIVARHEGHVASLVLAWEWLMGVHLPERRDLHRRRGPMFERYGPEFDPAGGTGAVEIWVPVERV